MVLYLGMTYLVFTVDSVTSTNASSSGAARHSSGLRSIAPVSSALSVRTVPSHMACVATNSTDNVSSKITLLWAIIFAMTDLTACNEVSKVCGMEGKQDTYSFDMLGSRRHGGYR